MHFGGALSIGIGVDSGTVDADTVGGGGRVEFTVIGDPVNTAARVEGATRVFGDTTLITEATRDLLTGYAVAPRGAGADRVASRSRSASTRP